MPIKVPDNLPAKEILRREHIFVMDESVAFHQDIRPLRIAILNLMPNKQVTEVQLLRLLGNTPLQIEITLMHMRTHVSKNTPMEYLLNYYTVFDGVADKRFDGMIITGAPVEQMDFEEVTYWRELTEIMDWTKKNVMSTFHICWGAQAGLYHHYGVPKHPLQKKMFGVFPHTVNRELPLTRGFDGVFYAPHSRHTEIRRADIIKADGIEIISESERAGVYIVMSDDERRIFITGHSEYDPHTLKDEYERDVAKGEPIEIPENYFACGDPSNAVNVMWRGHSNLLFTNWLNYYVYQETPYDLSELAALGGC